MKVGATMKEAEDAVLFTPKAAPKEEEVKTQPTEEKNEPV